MVKDNGIRATRDVEILGEDIRYRFMDCTPVEALQKMIYMINWSHKCDPEIEESLSGRTLWFEDDGKLYATINR